MWESAVPYIDWCGTSPGQLYVLLKLVNMSIRERKIQEAIFFKADLYIKIIDMYIPRRRQCYRSQIWRHEVQQHNPTFYSELKVHSNSHDSAKKSEQKNNFMITEPIWRVYTQNYTYTVCCVVYAGVQSVLTRTETYVLRGKLLWSSGLTTCLTLDNSWYSADVICINSNTKHCG